MEITSYSPFLPGDDPFEHGRISVNSCGLESSLGILSSVFPPVFPDLTTASGCPPYKKALLLSFLQPGRWYAMSTIHCGASDKECRIPQHCGPSAKARELVRVYFEGGGFIAARPPVRLNTETELPHPSWSSSFGLIIVKMLSLQMNVRVVQNVSISAVVA